MGDPFSPKLASASLTLPSPTGDAQESAYIIFPSYDITSTPTTPSSTETTPILTPLLTTIVPAAQRSRLPKQSTPSQSSQSVLSSTAAQSSRLPEPPQSPRSSRTAGRYCSTKTNTVTPYTTTIPDCSTKYCSTETTIIFTVQKVAIIEPPCRTEHCGRPDGYGGCTVDNSCLREETEI